MAKPSFLGNGEVFQETATVGGFMNAKASNNFDDIFTEAVTTMNAKEIDPLSDITMMVKSQTMMEAYKDQLLGTLQEECEQWKQAEANDPTGNTCYGTHTALYEQVSDMFDNCVEDLVKESTRVGQLLPIKAIDLPILIKQQLKLATKDIMQTETTRTPIVKKHIEQTYIVDNNDKSKRWRFPQCFFSDEYIEAYEAGKGFPIKEDVVPIDDIKNFNIVEKLTDAPIAERENITIALSVAKVTVANPNGGDDIVVTLKQPMRVNLSDNQWLGGRIQETVKDADGNVIVEVDDNLLGTCDFRLNTVSMKAINDQITGVIFSGHISNELNERSVTFDYEREEREWKIEDGSRVNASYSLEELEDTKALMDIDLYRKTYNNMTEYMVQQEDSDILRWLDEQFELYKGTQLDVLGFDPFIVEDKFDCDSTSITTALPCEFISKMLKFKIDRLITDIADNAKLDGFTFVIYGNPRYISFLNPEVNWVTRPGSTINGVKLDYSYGIMTSGDVKVQVVSTKKVNAKYDKAAHMHRGLRFIPFPTSPEQFTFKHYKYTTHILTAQNSAYRDPNKPGGSMTNLMGVSRYTNASIQGIQAQLGIVNAEPYINML